MPNSIFYVKLKKGKVNSMIYGYARVSTVGQAKDGNSLEAQEKLLKENGVDYEFVPDLYPKKTRVIRVARYVRKFQPDVVISYLLSTNLTICLASLFVKSKMVVSERNNNTTITLEDKFKFNLYRFADAVVPNSNSQGKFICSNFSFLKHRRFYPDK